jgi:hypothetical protein
MVELGCAQRTNLEKTASSEGVGEARPEEILLRVSYRIVNVYRPEKRKAVSFQAVSNPCRFILPGTAPNLVEMD